MTDHQYEHFKTLLNEELRASERTTQSAQYWTLSQAAAWVMFRDIAAVAHFTPPRADHFGSYMMYPTSWLQPVMNGQWHDLFRRLETGGLIATGRRASDGLRESIPALSWIDLHPEVDAGPYIRLVSGTAVRPWTDILIVRADVEGLWRRPSEVDGRSKYSKAWFQERYRALRETPSIGSKNELIGELQEMFQAETKREAPSRTSIQNYLRGL